MGKARLEYIDVAKGLLIVLLLIHHFFAAAHRNDIESEYFVYISCWQPIVTAFFMQGFFFITGYCSNFKKSANEFYYSLFRQLVVPLVVFQFVDCVWSMIIHNDFSLNTFFLPFSHEPYTSLWFVSAMIMAKIIVRLLVNRYSDNVLLLLSFMLLCVGVVLNQTRLGPNVLCYKNALGSVFFVALGYYMKTRLDLFQKCQRYSVGVFALLMFVFFFFEMEIPTLMASINMRVKNILPFVVISSSGLFAFLYLCSKVKSQRLLEYFGKNTLVIYSLHFPPLFLMFRLLWNYIAPSSVGGMMLFFLLLYLLELLICAVYVEVVNSKFFKWIVAK